MARQSQTAARGWAGSGAGAAVVTNTAQYPGSAPPGVRGGLVSPGGSVTNTFTTSSNRIWVVFQTKLSYWEEDTMPAVDSNATVQFCVNTNSRPVLRNGTTGSWQTLTNDVLGSTLPSDLSNGWIRVAIFTHYTNHTWALMITNRVAAQGVGFISNVSSFTQFVVGNGETMFDDLLVTNSVPLALLGDVDSDADQLPDAWELHCFGSINGANTGTHNDFDGDGSDNLAEYEYGSDPANSTDRPPRRGAMFIFM